MNRFRKLIAALAIVLSICNTFGGCMLVGTQSSGTDDSSYDTAFKDEYEWTEDLILPTAGYEDTLCVQERYQYNEGTSAERSGLLLANINQDRTLQNSWWAMDLAPTFQGNTEIEYLLPALTDEETSWGITAFAVCTPDGEEVGYAGRMHFDGQGQFAGDLKGTGYVYDVKSDKYMTSNDMYNRLLNVTKTLTMEDGRHPFFAAQQTISNLQILPNVRGETPGKIVFQWNETGNKLEVWVTIRLANIGMARIGEINGAELKDGYKIRVRHVYPQRDESTGKGVYRGAGHSALLLSLNGVSLSGLKPGVVE